MSRTTGGRPDADVDVVVVGDGPAGAAIAAACDEAGLGVGGLGSGRPWTNTYGAWVDEVPAMPERVWSSRTAKVIVGGARLRRVDRSYGVFDNAALRDHLGADRRFCAAHVTHIVDRGDRVEAVTSDGATVRARWAVDARGADPATAKAWQTAYGVVVDEEVADTVAATDATTLMDWSWSGSLGTPSFLYVIPMGDRWLIEHTVLAARQEVAPMGLRRALVDRLGEAAVAAAEAAGDVEQVRIPMGVPAVSGTGRIVRFGAAAGLAHPATGYSVTAALAGADRVARALSDGADPHAAVWPGRARRVRQLHDVGLDALLRLDPVETASFFEAFFDLPVETWSAYMRAGDDPRAVARAMAGVFRRAPWSVRRRLAHPDRRLVAGLLGS